jgi:phosphatidylethanolamine-binding protein (PEBP) family uncharacterized protein
MNKRLQLFVALSLCAMLGSDQIAHAGELKYSCSQPPLEVTYEIVGDRYNGKVNCGNLFLQSDIPTAAVVRWKEADPTKLYTLMMLDFDGNANGSWPDPVPSGNNAPVRHWIVGNIPGALLRTSGYAESDSASENKAVSVLQPYRAPHIPMVSDRYGIYLFEQTKRLDFAALSGPITNFDDANFRDTYHLGGPKASTFFVAIYLSESPFSGKPFQGNDVSKTWHQDYGKGNLTPNDQ